MHACVSYVSVAVVLCGVRSVNTQLVNAQHCQPAL